MKTDIMLRYTIIVLALSEVAYVFSSNAAEVGPTCDEQCRAKGFVGACTEWPTVHFCKKLECAGSSLGGRWYKRVILDDPPSRGTHCGWTGICSNKRCVEGQRKVFNSFKGPRKDRTQFFCAPVIGMPNPP